MKKESVEKYIDNALSNNVTYILSYNVETFDFDILPWALRNTGDDTTNPKPSFVGSTINNIHFFF